MTSGEAEQRYDLFSGLLDASRDELNKDAALSDEELIGKHPYAALLLTESYLAS